MAVNPETLRFIFELTKEGPEAQLKDCDAMDTKMTALFGAGSVIIALAGLSAVKTVTAAVGTVATAAGKTAAIGATTSASPTASPSAATSVAAARGANWAVALLLFAAVVFYVVSGMQALRGLLPRRFRRSVQADEIWQQLWNRGPDEIRHVLVADISAAYAHNKVVLVEKAGHVRWSAIWLGLEVVAIGLALVASQFT